MGRTVKGRVVVISPSKSDLLLYGDILERDGFEIVKIGDVTHAAALLSERQDTLVLITFEGWVNEALALIHQQCGSNRNVRFIGIASAPEIARLAQAAGCIECIQIPAPIMAVIRTIQRHAIPLPTGHASLSPQISPVADAG